MVRCSSLDVRVARHRAAALSELSSEVTLILTTTTACEAALGQKNVHAVIIADVEGFGAPLERCVRCKTRRGVQCGSKTRSYRAAIS